MFEQKYENNQSFFIWKFSVCGEGDFSIYLNRRVSVMSFKFAFSIVKVLIKIRFRTGLECALLIRVYSVRNSDPTISYSVNLTALWAISANDKLIFFLTIMKTRLFKYIENFTTKKWKFSKNSYILHISNQNIDRRGGSNEYPKSMILAEIRKIMYTPVNPSFTI